MYLPTIRSLPTISPKPHHKRKPLLINPIFLLFVKICLCLQDCHTNNNMCNFSSISFRFFEYFCLSYVLVNVLTFFSNIVFELKWMPIRVSQVEVVCNISFDMVHTLKGQWYDFNGDPYPKFAQCLQFISLWKDTPHLSCKGGTLIDIFNHQVGCSLHQSLEKQISMYICLYS